MRDRVVRTSAIAAAATLVIGLLVGVAIGNWASDNNIKEKLLSAMSGASAHDLSSQTSEWTAVHTNLYDLQRASIQLAPFDTYGRGGAIDELAGGIVFASPNGQFGYLSPDNTLHVLDLEAPLNSEALYQNQISQTSGFLPMMFRVLDILVVPRAATEFDLYVSHHRFAGDCFEIVVSHAGLTLAEGALVPNSDWRDVFVAEPCVAPKTTGMLFEGNESGGRLAVRDANTLLLALGDLQFNGIDAPEAYAQDPNLDLGKIVAIDLATGRTRRISSGHRNPQGLLVARDGTIWSTEHGPQGGDELNIIREGQDYGWPTVTYGVNYGFGSARRDWPANPVQGRHDNFEPPAFAFVPSISISNIIQPNADVFPLWRDHLIIASLYSSQQLYLARTDGDRIAYLEQIEINAVARDLITMSDGRIAILTDTGELLFLRKADETDIDPLTASAAQDVLDYVEAHPPFAVSPDMQGPEVFTFTCSACHSLSGVASVGPPLDGVVGRRVGGFDGYNYSPALEGRTETWTRQRIINFLMDADGAYPGTMMPQPGLSREHAEAVARFLESGDDRAGQQ